MSKERLEGEIKYKITIVSQMETDDGTIRTQHWGSIYVDSLSGLLVLSDSVEEELLRQLRQKAKII